MRPVDERISQAAAESVSISCKARTLKEGVKAANQPSRESRLKKGIHGSDLQPRTGHKDGCQGEAGRKGDPGPRTTEMAAEETPAA